MPAQSLHTRLLSTLGPLSDKVREVLSALFLIAFERLKAAEIGNPLIHHLVVLDHAREIATAENLDPLLMGSIALCHDVSPDAKIRVIDVLDQEDPQLMELVEHERIQYRRLHLRDSAAITHRLLLRVNEYFGRVIYNDQAIETIVAVVAIHDNPALGLRIPKEPHAVAFRDADRLWMLSREGYSIDLARDRAHPKNVNLDLDALASKRLKHILARFAEERALYSGTDGPFFDGSTFFRTARGYQIYLRYVGERCREYGIRL